jgi:hypothetical protein
VNLSAKVPGWIRYGVAEDKLKQMAVAKTSSSSSSSSVETALARPKGSRGSDAADQEKLFQQFLEWSKKQKR